ncbi:cytochrome P450 [Actinosynnema sp. NPDC050801]|uniref:cytochrome P450 n=1 Tax=unclassified Actinosynnema TaxID=2637065 RepID=UPI0033BFF277
MVGTTRGFGGSDFVEGRHRRHLVGETVPDHDLLVTGYRETKEFLGEVRLSRAAVSERITPRGPALRMSVTEMDSPVHTRIRGLVGGAFSARRSERLRPLVERTAEQLLGELVRSGPTADLVTGFAPLAFTAHCELLGVPVDRREPVWRRSVDRLAAVDAEQTYRAELRLHDEVSDVLDRGGLPPGLLADLVAAHRDAGLLTATELTGVAASLFFDGHALATAQIGNAALAVLTRPALHAELREDRGLLDGVIEESLRHSPSVTLSMARIATSDLDLGGTRVKAGQRVVSAIPLANRDPEVFDSPHEFDPSRQANRRHLTFGRGAHHCVGAHLTRIVVRAALGALLDLPARPKLAVPEEELAWYASPTMRGLKALPVRWNVASGGTDG